MTSEPVEAENEQVFTYAPFRLTSLKTHSAPQWRLPVLHRYTVKFHPDEFSFFNYPLTDDLFDQRHAVPREHPAASPLSL